MTTRSTMSNPVLHQCDSSPLTEGLLLVDKAKGRTSFSLVHFLRKRLGVKKIGHAGTLDPFATGVMVMLIGRRYTKLSDRFLGCGKEYLAEVFLGTTTDTYDCDGKIIAQSPHIPLLEDIEKALESFQGTIEQIPPMYSAKKKQGKKLYELARKGQEVEREPVQITIQTRLIRYEYPYLELQVDCSKGTYIRSIAYDLGVMLGCGAHLTNLRRTRSGCFHLDQCVSE
ncbi:MAG: tRNA pseudouridine(55) synthase TruB, partial [Cyanobacteria bacterium]|nr:tRNA pseudouridine(55) synthase TruB [Cyanobacteriota bacterium]